MELLPDELIVKIALSCEISSFYQLLISSKYIWIIIEQYRAEQHQKVIEESDYSIFSSVRRCILSRCVSATLYFLENSIFSDFTMEQIKNLLIECISYTPSLAKLLLSIILPEIRHKYFEFYPVIYKAAEFLHHEVLFCLIQSDDIPSLSLLWPSRESLKTEQGKRALLIFREYCRRKALSKEYILWEHEIVPTVPMMMEAYSLTNTSDWSIPDLLEFHSKIILRSISERNLFSHRTKRQIRKLTLRVANIFDGKKKYKHREIEEFQLPNDYLRFPFVDKGRIYSAYSAD